MASGNWICRFGAQERGQARGTFKSLWYMDGNPSCPLDGLTQEECRSRKETKCTSSTLGIINTEELNAKDEIEKLGPDGGQKTRRAWSFPSERHVQKTWV